MLVTYVKRDVAFTSDVAGRCVMSGGFMGIGRVIECIEIASVSHEVQYGISGCSVRQRKGIVRSKCKYEKR
jgi:hypothetical protein